MSYQQEPAPEDQQRRKRDFLNGPGAVITVICIAIAGWFLYAIATPDPQPPANQQTYGPGNYSGEAEVLKIADLPSKCYVWIKRETGQETKQSIRAGDCGKFDKGDLIIMEKGQYVSTKETAYEREALGYR